DGQSRDRDDKAGDGNYQSDGLGVELSFSDQMPGVHLSAQIEGTKRQEAKNRKVEVFCIGYLIQEESVKQPLDDSEQEEKQQQQDADDGKPCEKTEQFHFLTHPLVGL